MKDVPIALGKGTASQVLWVVLPCSCVIIISLTIQLLYFQPLSGVGVTILEN